MTLEPHCNSDSPKCDGERFLRNLARECHLYCGRFIVVTHLMSSSIPFLEAVSSIAPIACIIPKPHSIFEFGVQWAKMRRIPLLEVRRTRLEDGDYALGSVSKYIGGESFIILDIGGYFASSAATLHSHYSERFIGVVEDTENGHQRYQRADVPVPCISVARSECKRTEDCLVGESIVFSAESILRSSGQLLRGRNSLVIGYGKIGQSIALDLCRRGVRVAVCDSDPLRLSLAASHGYSVVHPANKQAAFAGADCIFCATGNHSIIADEWSGIKNGAFVFAATSADDEFEMSGLSEYSSTQLVTHVTTLRCQNRHFHLAVDGNAVNFVHGAEVRPFIYLVQGAMIESIASLVRGRALSPGMQELPIEAERKVARYFMAEHYGHPPQHSRKDFRSTAPPAPVRIKFRLRSRTMSVIEE